MITVTERGYRFLRNGFQFSSGIATLPGYALERIRLRTPLPLAEGFDWIKAELTRRGLATTALAATELRSPEPLTPDGFVAFNRLYAAKFEEWGIFTEDTNPVARSNVCPVHGAPAEPCFHAVTVVVPDAGAKGNDFVISGAAETLAGKTVWSERVAAFRDCSEAGLLIKAECTAHNIAGHLDAFGLAWKDCEVVQTYTAYDLPRGFMERLARRNLGLYGQTWVYSRPPIIDIEFEMDCRSVRQETTAET